MEMAQKLCPWAMTRKSTSTIAPCKHQSLAGWCVDHDIPCLSSIYWSRNKFCRYRINLFMLLLEMLFILEHKVFITPTLCS